MITSISAQRIRDAVDQRREDIVAILLDLVGAESITLNEGAVQRRVRAHMERLGLDIDEWQATPEEITPYIVHVGEQATYDDRPNLVGTRSGTGGGRSLMLQGHIDTVPAGDPDAWQHSYLGERIGDRVYGLGSADMKGGDTAALAALMILDDLGVRLQGDVQVATTVGEEDGGLGALSLILRGYRPDGVIITEPTGRDIVLAHGGSLVFRITVTGKSAHGGSRMDGVSAFEKFVPIFQDLLAWEAERNRTVRHPLYDHLENKFPISVGVVRAGEWASTVPDTCVAEGRLGFLPGETIEGMMRQAEARIAAVAASDPWMKEHPPKVEWFGGQFAAAEIDREHPLVQTLASAVETTTGEPPVYRAITAGLDMRLFTDIGNIPTVVFGAGDIRVVHAPNEYLEIDELLGATTTLVQTIIDWCGVDESESER